MGTPTSLALSNLVTIALDQALSDWAKTQQIVYIRFVDALSFSSKDRVIDTEHFAKIQEIAVQEGFQFNPTKIRFFEPHLAKKVASLLLNATVDIDPKF